MPPLSSLAVPETSRFVAGALCGVATVAIWAGWLVMMRLGITTTLAVVDLTALRFAVAGLILLPVVGRRGFALDRLGWPGFLTIGAGLMFARLPMPAPTPRACCPSPSPSLPASS